MDVCAHVREPALGAIREVVMRALVVAAIVALPCSLVAGAGRASADGSGMVGPRCPLDAPSVPPGGNIQAALDSASAGTAVCLEDGAYVLTAALHPHTGQTLVGVPDLSVLDAGSLAVGVEAKGATGVTIEDLTVTRGGTGIRSGSGWVVDGVTAENAATTGIVIGGTGAAVMNSRMLANGRYGVTANLSVNGVLENSEVAGNNTRLLSPKDAGGSKF